MSWLELSRGIKREAVTFHSLGLGSTLRSTEGYREEWQGDNLPQVRPHWPSWWSYYMQEASEQKLKVGL